MLLEYNVDTKDEVMKEKAIELRKRVAGRKLNEALDDGTIDGKGLVEIKEKNRDQRKEHLQERLIISNASLNERISLARADQQLKAENQLKVLSRDVSRASRLSKAKFDVLSDLESRVKKMRVQLKDPKNPPIETIISQELQKNDKKQLEQKFNICSCCNRKILIDLLPKHIVLCEQRKLERSPTKIGLDDGFNNLKSTTKKLTEEELRELEEEQFIRPPIYDIEQTVQTALATFPPQPPRHCKVVSKGVTYIDWEWQPPIIDGGLAITDYEISFLGQHVLFDPIRGKYKRWEETIVLKTTRFCYAHDPIAHTGYRIDNLRGGSDYTNFQIRCCNIRGWSAWVDMLDKEEVSMQKQLKQQQSKNNSSSGSNSDGMMPSDEQSMHSNTTETYQEKQLRMRLSIGRVVSTFEPEAPTPPLFVNCNLITSSCIHLDWYAPYYHGGVPIVLYTIHYTVLERKTTVTARDVVFEHVLKFKVPGEGEACSGVIRNLPPNTEVVKIYIIAKNEIGLLSPKGILKQNICKTYETSRYGQLSRELTAASTTTGPYFDSDFYTGVRQRLNRLEHMKQLSAELEATEVDPVEREEDKEWAAILELQQLRRQQKEEEKKRQEELDLAETAEDAMDREEAKLQIQSNSFLFTMRQRYIHYKKKLYNLDLKIKQLKKERQDIDSLRTQYTLDMRQKEKLLLSYKLEIERLRQYTGQTIISSVLNGYNMQYKINEYNIKIELIYQKCLNDIANIKYIVINNENKRITIKKELEDTELLKSERIAKFYEFNQEYQRKKRIIDKLSAGMNNNNSSNSGYNKEYNDILYKKYFQLLVQFRKERIYERVKIRNIFMNLIQRYLKSGFDKWKYGEYKASSSRDTQYFISKGDIMLQQSNEKRMELQLLLQKEINNTTMIQQNLNLLYLSSKQTKKLINNENYHKMEEGINHIELFYEKGLKLLYEGDGYIKLNKFELALSMYEGQIIWLRSRPNIDIKSLAICHGRLGQLFLLLNKNNRAIVEYDRQLSLGNEIQDNTEIANAYYGLGKGYCKNYDYDNSIRYLNIALILYNNHNNYIKYKNILLLLKDIYEKINNSNKVSLYNDKIKNNEDSIYNEIELANFKINDMQKRLLHTAAEIEYIINIEKTTFLAMKLKNNIKKNTILLNNLENEKNEKNILIGSIILLLKEIDKEINEAEKTNDKEMWSILVHDQPQIVEIEELKTRLKSKKNIEINNLTNEELLLKNIQIKIKNIEMNINIYEEELSLEEGELMKSSQLEKPFRCIGLCSANTAGNEVTGTGSGGYEEFIAAEGKHIYMLDYHTGGVNYVYMGGGGVDLGHTGVVTCVLHDGKLIFSGSTDETIISWETATETRARVNTFIGHEGSIVSLAVEGKLLASGSSDSTLRLWDKHTAQQLRIVYGHSRSVLSIEIGPTWMLTGSTDTEVRVWKIGKTKRGSLAVDCQYRLIGHEETVTCVRYGQIEVVSGDVKGRIFIWWMKTGEILRRCQVHDGPVKCMQFDSLHIVSGGADYSVCITDIATGEVLQTLRGHIKAVLALAFDSERIISVSGDNTIRYWQWGQSTPPTDKVHVLDKGETLHSLAKRYTIKMDEIMKWNGITDIRQCFTGMNLIVRKADPDQLTTAEKLLLQKEKRQEGGAKLAEKTMKDNEITKNLIENNIKLTKYNRIHKIATDIDNFSLGNRLFGNEKRQLELFPDKYNPNINQYSMAGRFELEENRKKEEKLKENKGLSDLFHTDNMNNNEDDTAMLEWALKTGSKIRPRYFISSENIDEWEDVSNSLGIVMLQMLVEYEAYDIVMEQKRMLRSKQSVIGRINTRQMEIEQEKRRKLLEQNIALIPSTATATASGSGTSNEMKSGGLEVIEEEGDMQGVAEEVGGGVELLLSHGGADLSTILHTLPTTTPAGTADTSIGKLEEVGGEKGLTLPAIHSSSQPYNMESSTTTTTTFTDQQQQQNDQKGKKQPGHHRSKHHTRQQHTSSVDSKTAVDELTSEDEQHQQKGKKKERTSPKRERLSKVERAKARRDERAAAAALRKAVADDTRKEDNSSTPAGISDYNSSNDKHTATEQQQQQYIEEELLRLNGGAFAVGNLSSKVEVAAVDQHASLNISEKKSKRDVAAATKGSSSTVIEPPLRLPPI